MKNPSFDELMHFNPYHDPKNGQFTDAPVWGSRTQTFPSSKEFLDKVEELREQEVVFTDKDGKSYTGEMEFHSV